MKPPEKTAIYAFLRHANGKREKRIAKRKEEREKKKEKGKSHELSCVVCYLFGITRNRKRKGIVAWNGRLMIP
jgi:hypothetical protein